MECINTNKTIYKKSEFPLGQLLQFTSRDQKISEIESDFLQETADSKKHNTQEFSSLYLWECCRDTTTWKHSCMMKDQYWWFSTKNSKIGKMGS